MNPALVALALLAAGAPEQQSLTVDPSASVLRFHVDHRLHPVDGRSSSIEGRAVIAPDGKVLAMVRVPVASFDTGDANRDSNMRETLEASRHPFVVFKGVTRLDAPAARGRPIETTLRGELDFHGVKSPVEVPVTVQFADDGSAQVKGRMKVSLDAHRIERPSLLFVKLDDTCTIDLELRLRRGP
jgi:polyisoprenoid-binding protein YceI